VTQLRVTRRRALAALGGVGLGSGLVAAIPSRRVAASLRTPEWVVRVRGPKAPAVPDLASLDPAARRAVRDAIAGGYESTDPAAAVRDLFRVDDVTYVRADGAYYRLDPTLPVYEVWLAPVSEAAVEDPVTLDEMEQCSHPDPRGFVPPPTARRGDPYRTYHLDPALESCIEDHPYLELGGEYYRYRTAVDDPGVPYAVDATRVSARTVAGIEGPSVAWADVPSDARTLVRAAVESGRPNDGDGSVTRESVPDSLRDVDARYDWIRRGDGFYAVDLDHAGGAPIDVGVRVVEARTRELDPAWLAFSVTNTGGRPVRLSTGPPEPFGILRARRLDGDGEDGTAGDDRRSDGGAGLTLWSREYVTSRFIGTYAGRVAGVAAVGRSVTLRSGETREQRYAVRRNPGRLETGTYRVDDAFLVAVGEESPDEVTVPFEVDVRVT
jgi:hypothetical protein